MKTMMDLLVRLQAFEKPVVSARRERQLSPHEDWAAQRHLDLVREIIPAEVLACYDQMKATDQDLFSQSPGLFAMAVLLATYRSLPMQERKKLIQHFSTNPNSNSLHSRDQKGASRRVAKRLPRAARRFALVL